MASPQSAGRSLPVTPGATVPGTVPGAPSVLDLVRLSPDPVFPPGGEGLYRQIALLTELQPEHLLLDAACGRGIGTEFLATTTGAEAYGLDPNPVLVAEAEQRVRSAGRDERIHFETGSLQDLPYRDGIFDVAIGGVGMAALVDPGRAVRELARVTRPMGAVVLVQLIWTGNVDAPRKEQLVQHLGARPMMLVEWKQLLRDAGVVELHVEDWSDYASPFRPAITGPFHDINQIFSFKQKAVILHRAFRRWGWRGVRGAIVREVEIHRLLTRERVLGLTLIKGTKWDGGNS
jgi:SAM-dependent methyltransferase